MSDFTKIKEYLQTRNTSVVFELYMKYRPLVIKMSAKVKDRNEFIVHGYDAMQNCLNSIKETSIGEGYKLGFYYSRWLYKEMYSLNKQNTDTSIGYDESFVLSSDSGNTSSGVISGIAISPHASSSAMERNKTFDPEIQFFRAETMGQIDKFLASLTPFEKEVLELRQQGLTITEIANKFRESFSMIQRTITRLKNRVSKMSGVCYA